MTTLTIRPNVLRPLRLLVFALVGAALLGAPAATAQSLMQEPVTKQELEEAKKTVGSTASTSTSTDDDSAVLWALVGAGVLVLGGAAAYMLRDASFAVGGNRQTVRTPVDPGTVRGAPKALFTGDAEPGGKVGKRKKRTQGKRQRQARKANRPR